MELFGNEAPIHSSRFRSSETPFVINQNNDFFCSDDLLNYELGEVDDNDLTGADEDELLLSDEGKSEIGV